MNEPKKPEKASSVILEAAGPKYPKYQSYRYFIVLPHEECSASQLSQHLKSFCKKFSFQGEMGEGEFNYKHWSIEVSLKTKEYFLPFKNLLGFNKAHIESTRDYFAAKQYNKKQETRIEGPYNEKSVFLDDELEGKKYYDWQQKIVDIYLSKTSRKVHWFWEEKGNVGKTSFARHMVIKFEGVLYVSGKAADIKCAITKYLEEGNELKMCIFDYPRSSHGYISYSAIEEVLNGIFFSGKYESAQVVFNRPHVVCFSNQEPKFDEMSDDRWVVTEITQNPVVTPHARLPLDMRGTIRCAARAMGDELVPFREEECDL